MPSFAGPRLPADYAELLAEGLGGVTLFGSNMSADLRVLTDAIHAANPAAVVSVDEEGGDVTRLHAASGSPVLGAAALGVIDDLAITRETGRLVGEDLCAAGIDLDLAPVADVNSNPDNPVIGSRSFSASAAVAASHVAAWVEGLQSAGVAACVKHFPGHGHTGEDSHLALPTLSVPVEVLQGRELAPFRAALAAGARSVMTSHIVVPTLDPELPATLSPRVLGMLREGYDGVIVSDALDMAGASAIRGIPAAAVGSLVAGADLLCIGADKPAALVREIQAAIIAAVADGTLPLPRLLDAAARAVTLSAHLTFRTRHADECVRDVRCTGVETARRSITVTGELPDLAGALVASIDTEANIAIGDVPWGLRPDLRIAPGDGFAGAGGGALIVQVRDAHRHPEVRAVIEALAATGVTPVVLEWGWPARSDDRFARICTHGYSRPGVEAVTELLRKAGWDR